MKYCFKLFVILLLCIGAGYYAGERHSEQQRHARHDAVLNACREDNTILQRRYDSLAQESDWLTIVSAEKKYQEGGHGE